MKVLFLISDPERPSTRHRMRNLVPGLEKAGVSCVVEEVPSGIVKQSRLMRKAADFDVTVLQRRLLSFFPAGVLRRAARRLVYDFDDALMYRNTPEGPQPSGTRERRFKKTIAMMDEVWVGNRVLEAASRPHLKPGAAIRVVPTVIDTDRWAEGSAPDKPPSRPLVIGWMGAPGNVVYLEALKDVFDRLSDRFPGIRLRIVSQKFIDCARMPVEKHTWTLDSEVREVRDFDIALAPLHDDAWTRGKCALRILNYFAAGVAVVCSPVGANAEVVTPGVTGEHATKPEEWYEAIARLATDAERRDRLARAGQERARSEYSIRALTPRLASYLESLAAEPRPARG
jgi:glycosyltransferase involved in cell wall biosynthesis